MRTIMVTGCSSGIGEHCAKRLKRDGWQVFATVRSPKDIAALEAQGICTFHLDYTDTASIHAAMKQVLEKTAGTLDALFNNGAYGQPGAVEDLTTDVLRQQFEANFFGWHELTNLAVPVMRRQGGGRIVHCSSVLGWIPMRWRGAYNASKYALEGLASTMRLELKQEGIHVCLIEPGPIRTRFSENALEMFQQNVDVENSFHATAYKAHMKARKNKSGAGRFELGPEAVYTKLNHALTAKTPRAHYGVTIPTHVMDFARRFLPQRLVDHIIVSGG